MASQHRIRQRRTAAGRGLLLAGKEILILAICAVGLMAAWLAHGTAGAYGGGNDVSSGVPSPTISAPVSIQAKEPPAAFGTPEPETPASAFAPPTQGTPSPAGPGVAPIPEQAGALLPVASAPVRVTYPKAQLDVMVHALEPQAGSQSIEPPVTTEGYWLTPFGMPGAGSTDTTYIVGHSWLDRDAPFNHLSSAAVAGDEFNVITATGEMTYKVESVTTHTKTTLKDSPIWAVVPNQLVLISCYTEDPWGKNVTVVASPVPGH
ncbi:class F sortase [Arthrobacter sp. SA17]